ncbi:helix-turn-helix transcriptional regulator [Microbacterium sp. 2C]|uniref:Helix-turn-helix transcriptional regulator n=1 Tax=Brachybacterium equifaecis TaxID=2910770 RepID=A0ABT0R3B2_9MICO|nr:MULTISPECIES: helix-turn-helix transcriptional regulator [Micrococcales]MBG0717192.1 helix-turn-helix transcriptional regulator [Microbacterium paulum]MCL6424412.1 helix-turn-helix transcriptional regulator [Brachybacterium equifaecis]
MTTKTITWRLRTLMAERGMFKTTDLLEPLKAEGVALSREQVFRLVTQTPQRLNVEVLAALCTILDCTPSDLLVLEQVAARPAEATGTGGRIEDIGDLRPVPARITRPKP